MWWLLCAMVLIAGLAVLRKGNKVVFSAEEARQEYEALLKQLEEAKKREESK